jgi:hypothetical protein
MLDNKDSLNNQQDNTKVNREIHPWLRKRLEERARPLTSQKLPQLVHSGSQLARWVVNHTGLASMISRAERLISLPRSFGSLISRKPTDGISGRYPILNLPWFKPIKSNRQKPTDKIDFKYQGETASDIGGRFDNKMLQLLPESSKGKQVIIEEKMPETYIKHLISPPIARKSAADIVDNIVSPDPTKGSHARADQLNEINYSNASHKVVERKPSLGTMIRPTPLVSYSTTTEKAMTDKSSLLGRNYGTTITKTSDINKFNKLQTNSEKKIIRRLNSLPPNTSSGQSSPSARRMFLPIIPAQKNVSIINTSSLEQSAYSINRQKATGTKTVPNRLEVRQNRPDAAYGPLPLSRAAVRTAFDLTPNTTGFTSTPDASKTKSVDFTRIKDFKEPRQESHTTEIPTGNKLGAIVKDDAKIDASNSDSARDLLYRKPLSIGQRIVQLLPFIKKISRKMNRPAEPTHIPNEKQYEVDDNRLPTNNLEIVHPHDETPEVTLDNTVISGISDASKTKSVDFTNVKDFEEPRQESHTAEIPTMNKIGATVKDDTGKDPSHAYPTNDLSYRKSLPIGQRTAQSLPLIRNISRKVDLSSEITSSIGKKQHEINDIQIPSNNLAMLQVHGISDDIDKSKIGSLSTPRLVSATGSMITDNETSIRRKPDAIYDGTRIANNELDLALTLVNRLPATQQEGNYDQFNQSTRNIQRDQVSVATQSTQQTQAGQSSQSNAAQAAEMRPADENMNMKENQPDIRALAREIYPLIRRMIIIERERRPSR